LARRSCAEHLVLCVAASPDTQIGDVRAQPCTRFRRAWGGRHTSASDSFADSFADADAVRWSNDSCLETLSVDLAIAG
jgi:hypothetical protein